MTFQSNGPVANENYSIATGANSSGPFITVFMTRDPTSFDAQYPVKQRWVNKSTANEWILTGFSNATGQTLATWLQLSDGNALNKIGLPAPSGNGVTVVPDANGLINFTSTGGSIAFTGSNGGVGADNVNFEIASFSKQTFVPTISLSTPGTSSFTYTDQTGEYTVLSNVVFFTMRVSLSNFTIGSGAGDVQLGTLPFPSAASRNIVCACTLQNITFAGGVSWYSGLLGPSATIITFQGLTSASGQQPLQAAALSNTSIILVSGTYFTS